MKVRTLTAIIALIVFLPILLKGGLVLMIFANILALIAFYKRIVEYEYD